VRIAKQIEVCENSKTKARKKMICLLL